MIPRQTDVNAHVLGLLGHAAGGVIAVEGVRVRKLAFAEQAGVPGRRRSPSYP